ncbi:hypothetical protein ACPCSP_20255 [Streptomyces cinereoruber]|uniref:hypothetical protein n=1 Tax=Streptomyces cinereoruber TaxID=67260 RepID=UPI003C2CE316
MLHEPFGPEYVRPRQADCPDCGCCTAALCDRGRTSVMRCHGHVDNDHHLMVRECPCSAETTAQTAAWHMARANATRLAVERLLPADVEAMLRALADGVVPEDPANLFPQLYLRGLARVVDEVRAITEMGRVYLRARDGQRTVTRVQVVAVDEKADRAEVVIPAWRPGERVAVLGHQIVSNSGIAKDLLPGLWLEAEVNCDAAGVEELVVTQFRSPTPPPAEPVPPAAPEPVARVQAAAPLPAMVPVDEPALAVPLWMRGGGAS